MKVDRVQNGNTYFGAKLQVEGSVLDVHKMLIERINGAVRMIGDDNDIVSLSVGTKYLRNLNSGKVGHEANGCYRNNRIVSIINGQLKQKNIITRANSDKEDIEQLDEKIFNYFKELIKGKPKKLYKI